jgi:hypothetical protein
MSAGDKPYDHQISSRVMTDLLLIREERTAALQDLASSGIDWSLVTVILLKPDCLARELAESMLAVVSAHVTILTQQTVHPTAEQIFAHYDDILPLSAEFGVDVPAELRRIYLGQPVIIASVRVRRRPAACCPHGRRSGGSTWKPSKNPLNRRLRSTPRCCQR